MTTTLTSDLVQQVLSQSSTRENTLIVSGVSPWLSSNFEKYEVNTFLRISHFLAQALEETDGLHTLVEYASGHEYEGRSDLGNTEPGDGVRFKGRGIFQYTGRSNYEKISTILGVDFIGSPNLLAQPEYAVLSAFEYWKTHGLNAYADNDDINTITRKINGSLNGLIDREIYLKRVKSFLPQDLVVIAGNDPVPTPDPVPEPTTVILGKPGDNNPNIVILKGMFRALGADVDDSPLYDDKLTAAVKLYQAYVNLPVTGEVDLDTWNTLSNGVSV